MRFVNVLEGIVALSCLFTCTSVTYVFKHTYTHVRERTCVCTVYRREIEKQADREENRDTKERNKFNHIDILG